MHYALAKIQYSHLTKSTFKHFYSTFYPEQLIPVPKVTPSLQHIYITVHNIDLHVLPIYRAKLNLALYNHVLDLTMHNLDLFTSSLPCTA